MLLIEVIATKQDNTLDVKEIAFDADTPADHLAGYVDGVTKKAEFLLSTGVIKDFQVVVVNTETLEVF